MTLALLTQIFRGVSWEVDCSVFPVVFSLECIAFIGRYECGFCVQIFISLLRFEEMCWHKFIIAYIVKADLYVAQDLSLGGDC